MKLKKDKRGVFGLTAIQQFFAIILAVALLAYIIIIVMGVLGGTTILTSTTGSVTNESGYLNATGYTLGQASLSGFVPSITSIWNSSTSLIPSANYTLTGNVLYNATKTSYTNVNVTYTYTYNSDYQNNLNNILTNTSTGITGFFSSINPIYAILAVLVIILVLVVLVRVVQAPNEKVSPQL
jgi:hypothetical protein